MRVSELTSFLKNSPDSNVRFRLPDGELTPPHAHVTEVAHITKRFIDCGGTFREDSTCRLQTWVADDYNHRLTAGKLAGILKKAAPLLGESDLEVDVEHDVGFVTQFPAVSAEVVGSEVVVTLAGRHTACLAPELCCPPQPEQPLVTFGRKKE